MSCVLIIMSTLASAAIPVLTRSFLDRAGEKVSMDIGAIQDAARAYYIAHNTWPASITPTGAVPAKDLESNGFLPGSWNAVNPFGNPYTISVSGSIFTVLSQVADGIQVAVVNRLPASSYSGNTVSSSMPPPGESSSLVLGPLNCSVGSSGTALTDGIVMANGIFPGTNLYIYGYINGRLITSNSTISSSGGDTRYSSITMPVAKGENWSVSSNGGSFQVCWRPYIT
ncbi:MAG: type II secretion system protein [Candidatus Omnitrophica bacterium]|nr:type II secretion system protein [Candidatus Omnitrophota bacterium]